MRETYVDVTRSITGISLSLEDGRIKRAEQPVSAVIISKGVFKSRVVCVFPRQFLMDVVDKMSRGEQLDDEDWQSYVKEYLNICFGRVISKLNNLTGRASRFVIPVIVRGVYNEKSYAHFQNSVMIFFHSDHGSIKISIEYELLPEFASN